MKLIGMVVMVVSSLAVLAFGGRHHERATVVMSSSNKNIQMKIHSEDGRSEMTLRHKGEELVIDLDELVEGSRATYTLAGKEVEVIHNEDGGIKVFFDGEELNIFHDNEAQIWVDSGGDELHEILIDKYNPRNRVTISGLEDLDDDLKDQIIQAIRDAGVDKEVKFLPAHFMAIGGQDLLWETMGDERDFQIFKFRNSDQGSVFKIRRGEKKGEKY